MITFTPAPSDRGHMLNTAQSWKTKSYDYDARFQTYMRVNYQNCSEENFLSMILLMKLMKFYMDNAP